MTILAAFDASCTAKHPGSCVCLQVEFLRPMTVSILSERRTLQPFGLGGGSSARPGLNLLQKQNGRCVNLGGKATVQLEGGERLQIFTPGELPPHCIASCGQNDLHNTLHVTVSQC